MHAPPDLTALESRYRAVRARTERLLAPLSAEDYRIQSMPDVSPPWWNLGHTSWFFVANVLRPAAVPFPDFPGFDYALNSYYEGLGPRLPRANRGRVASPTTEQVRDYRRTVDRAMLELLATTDLAHRPDLVAAITIGLEHEEQHQELFLTEIQHIRWSAPRELWRAYREGPARRDSRPAGALRAVTCRGGLSTLGHEGDGFAWDNECPAHRVHVPDFALGHRLITNGEWQAFVDDGGYRRPLLWLSNGWAAAQQHGWRAPLYWQGAGPGTHFTLHGEAPIDPAAPVCHVSFYEADAFARWYGEQFASWRHARLPRESEWEHAARQHGFDQRHGNLLGDEQTHAVLDVLPADGEHGLQQLAGDAWEWTQSHYEPYPGYRPFPGALMEYNGKFMDNQRVLRGGSFATPRQQARAGYRNFWPPDTRFQVTGLRLLVDG